MMLSPKQKRFAEILSQIIDCNPFLPQRIELEKSALGGEFQERAANWNLHPSEHQLTENLTRLETIAKDTLESLTPENWAEASEEELPLVVDLVSFVLFNRFRSDFEKLAAQSKTAAKVYERFRQAWDRYLPPGIVPDEVTRNATHMFAVLFQIRRAFNNTFQNLIGSSEAIIDLRADVWRSIFTHNVRRYSNTMYRAMADFPTLIAGPTGSGKELVARAIGMSGYIPFDEENGKFHAKPDELFVSLNLSAISPHLIESELFGHVKGAFTGATEDRVGWLEGCPASGAVFLDEIGELDHDIQVKLLRVVQERTFQRVGDREPRHFHGRIIAATNRDLAEEMKVGRFRRDFFYRLCADQIETPGLYERVRTDEGELSHLVRHLTQRITGDGVGSQEDAEEISNECLEWIDAELGSQYRWPGNVRELDQCIRSWVIRRDYSPVALVGDENGKNSSIESALADCDLTADELLTAFCRVKYGQNGSYVQTAKQLGLDRRTVKSRVDEKEDGKR